MGRDAGPSGAPLRRALAEPLPLPGRLGRGGRADFCLLPAAKSAAASVEALVHGEAPVLATYCAGRRFGTKSAVVAAL